MFPCIEFKDRKFYLEKEDGTNFITTPLTLSGLNMLGIENKNSKVIVQIFNDQKFVVIYYEQDFNFNKERALFEILEIEITGPQTIKKKQYHFIDYLDFQTFFQDSYFLPLRYFHSYVVNGYVSHLPKIQQRVIHKYCKKVGSILPHVIVEKGSFYLKGNAVNEFMTTILSLSALNVFGIENKFHKVILQIPDDQQTVIIFLEDGFGYEKERKLFSDFENPTDDQLNSKKKVYFFNKYSDLILFLDFFAFFLYFMLRKQLL
jgi:hypothetical protein